MRRRAARLALALALTVTSPALADLPPQLDRFYAALAALESGRATEPVRIVQVGDSHTAADRFSGLLRARLQERFGNAGRGALPPGVPFPYYDPGLVSVHESPGWTHAAAIKADTPGPLGLDALRLTGRSPAATLTLDAPDGFERAWVDIAAAPHAGSLRVELDGKPLRPLATEAGIAGVRRLQLPVTGTAHRLLLAPAGDGPVALLGWGTTRARPGIVWENHGTIGATVALVGRMDTDALALELAQPTPALILVAFGTNEAFQPTLSPTYEQDYAAQVAALHRPASNASVLIIGPPDSLKASGKHGPWETPPWLPQVRAAQRTVAARHGYATWDWQAAMGGPGSMAGWVARDPPWALPDHVHLRKAGAEYTADKLFDALMQGFAAWKAAHPSHPTLGVPGAPQVR